MDLLRNYFWLWLILAIIFTSLFICIIFIFINKCIRQKGSHQRLSASRRYSEDKDSKKYEECRFPKPPLPPRTQFLLPEAQSYENIPEVTEERLITISQSPGDLESDHTHLLDEQSYQNHDEDLIKHQKDQTLINLDYQNGKLNDYQKQNRNFSASQNDDLTLTHFQIQDHLSNHPNQDPKLQTLHNQDQSPVDLPDDYVQITDEHSDYVEVKDEDEDVLEEELDLMEGNGEDYDDIGEEIHEEKDYDDIF
ncbi:uncharacterized protein LOC144212205 isoform X2 [Stigmatopora nigra]